MASRPRKIGDPLVSGDRRAELEAVRDLLAAALKEASPAVLAQIAAQYRATVAELAALPNAKKVSKADELAARRRQRQPTPNPRARSKRVGGE